MQALRAWKYWPWLRDLGIGLLLVAAVRVYQQRNLASGPAPALAAADIAGIDRSLATYRGAPVLVHFWATWCGACKAEQHNIDALAGDLPVLSVASRSGNGQQVAAYVSEHAIAPLVIADPDGALARRFGVGAFPTTFVIDSAGRIRHSEVGYSTELGLRARMWLARW
jgi:thiol-disulfide isomerase/thioredoxin